MGNNLAELKEKFIERFVHSKDSDGTLYWKYCRVEEVFSWIAENTVPKSEHESAKQALSKLQLQYLEANDQIEELLSTNLDKSELITKNELLQKQLAEAKAENEQLRTQLKNAGGCYNEVRAENEKLSAQRNNGKVVVQYLDGNFEEYDSYHEAKESILESYNDKLEGIHPDIECIKVLQEIYKIEVPENPNGTYSINFVPTKVSDELTQARQGERARIVEICNKSAQKYRASSSNFQLLTDSFIDAGKADVLEELKKAITADQQGETNV